MAMPKRQGWERCSKEDTQFILELYPELSITDIQNKLGLTWEVVTSVLEHNGVTILKNRSDVCALSDLPSFIAGSPKLTHSLLVTRQSRCEYVLVPYSKYREMEKEMTDLKSRLVEFEE